jgi:hypothetical protein
VSAPTSLTAAEQANVRAAIRFLRVRAGANTLAKALRADRRGLLRVLHGSAVSESLAVRVAKFAKVGVDDVLAGRFPEPGVCPHCGHKADVA